MSTLTWLHLSDLHFRADTSYDEHIVLRALLRDVEERIGHDGLRPDFVAVTGDIAFSGRPDQYTLARSFFDDLSSATGLGRDRLFLVPGNHDVDRSKVSRGAQGIADSLNSREAANDILATPGDRRLMLARFEGYAAFVNDYLGGHGLFDDEHFFYVQRLELAELQVALLGLNSAWVSASDRDRDPGLLLGERQVRAALDVANGADLKVALLHHPFDWLREFDRDDVEPLLSDNCHYILHGHMHQVGLLQARTPDSEVMVIAAGACYETRRYPNTYNWVCLDMKRGRGTVYLRTYSDRRGGFWTKDVLNYRNVPDGVYHFSLPAQLGGLSIDDTYVGRDRMLVHSGYTGEDLEAVLARLCDVLSTGRADLCADVVQDRLTITSPEGLGIELSAQAARDLLPVAARQADEKAYLAALVVNPRYGRWASQFVPLSGTLATFERPPGWTDIPPEFTLLEMSGEGPARQVRPVRLDDITQATDQHEALVLLGEPGAGKTTTLYKLALDAAKERLTSGQGRLPLVLSLADYRDYRSPHAFVEAAWRQVLGGDGQVSEYLRRGDLLLLCDALNEMPFHDNRDYRDRVRAWHRFVGDWPGNQILFTCRSRDYGEPLGLHQVEIERLNDDRVQEFLSKYLPQDLALEAWQQLKGTALLELVRNPYYLSILAFILAQGWVWPEGRAKLLESFVDLLLAREKTRNHPDWPGSGPLRTALSLLAERIQPLGEGTRLPRREMLARIPERVDGRDGPVEISPHAVLDLGLAATLLDTEFAPGDEELVRFYHHQLQECFAARALLARFRAREDLDERWRQPRLEREMPDLGPLGDFEPLPAPPTTGWEEPTILAAGLVPDSLAFVEAVRRVNPVLAARCLAESGVERPTALVEAVQADLLRDIGDDEVHVRARIAAGEALGRLDDPRFQVVEVVGRRVLLPPLVYVPAGPFRMGSGTWQVLNLSRWGLAVQDERPRHTVNLSAFLVGRFPVTNAEYACFMEAGGYRDTRHWPVAAYAWLQGEEMESEALKEWMRVWRALREDPTLLEQARRRGWTPQQLATWGQLSKMEEGQVRELLSASYADRPRDRPAFWDDERFSNPGKPVVGVSWYEAMAYCAWLTDEMSKLVDGQTERWPVWHNGRATAVQEMADDDLVVALRRRGRTSASSTVVRLPSEAEWEKAARGRRGWTYPWGNRWDAGRANTWEGHVLRTTPVGAYPGGLTPEGAHDLSGNVWEWTRSLYRPYPCQPGDGREALEDEGHRVVRGGSWGFNLRRARCAFRSRKLPDFYGNDLGFRVVVSIALFQGRQTP